MAEKGYVDICPICKSKDIHTDSSNKVLERFGSSDNWRCNRCKNSFPIVLEVSKKDIKNIKEEPLTEEIIHSTPNITRVAAGYKIAIVVGIFVLITVILIILNFVLK
ncbi:MAG: hypothetical protein ABIH20_05505 [Candidatus Diapherotrites archaeon]